MRRRRKLMFIDVKKAHLNGRLQGDEEAYIELPEGWSSPGKCGKLKRWLYGMRNAASAWERDYTRELVKIGFVPGVTAPIVFYHPAWEVQCVVHGDDFTFLGWERDLEHIASKMSEAYSLKIRGVMGGEPKDTQEIVILNRRLRWSNGELSYEADPEHAKKIWEALGLTSKANGLDKPIVKEGLEDLEDEAKQERLGPHEASEFRAVAARANYLSLDRVDMQFAAKEICRDMAEPRCASWGKLKRLARYLVEHPRLVWKVRVGGHGGPSTAADPDGDWRVLRVFSDSDWAGCIKTRRSTSGGVAMLGGIALKTWSSTQKTVALSVGEAEYIALVKAATEAIGIRSLARDLGWQLRLVVGVDSNGQVHRQAQRHWQDEALGGKGALGAAGRQGERVFLGEGGRARQSQRRAHQAVVRQRDGGQVAVDGSYVAEAASGAAPIMGRPAVRAGRR